MQTRTAAFACKDVDESGRFAGYGSVFDTVDSYKDIIEPGAFKSTLDGLKAKGRAPAMLWQHDPSMPVGKYDMIREDKHGLYVEGQLALKTQRGQEAHELMKMDAISGLSIGYMEGDSEYDKDAGVNRIKSVDLWEVSLVTFPANDDARISDVKAALIQGEELTERMVEKALREVGFSRSQAKAFIASGFAGISQRDAGSNGDALAALLRRNIELLNQETRNV